jgi:hypothetical protein
MDYRLGIGGVWLVEPLVWNGTLRRVFYFVFWHEIEWFYHWIAWWM